MLNSLLNSAGTLFGGGGIDSMAASALKPLIQKQIEGGGSVRDLSFDFRARKARVVIELTGDPTPLEIQVGSFLVENDGGKTRLRVTQWSSPSHQWVNVLGQRFLPQITESFDVPYSMVSAFLPS